MATILTKKKDTTGAPVAGDLTNSTGGAELAVNTADKRLYTKDSGGNVVEVGTNPGAAVTFTAGTVSAPAITTTGDTNTGVFFPAADTIAFAEGGAEAMRINSDSQVVTTAGTASLPAITTTGDVNTGIFFPAADTIAFAEGGAEAMRIDSSGRVGIGETNPTNALQVKRTSGASIIKTQTTDTASYSSLDTQSDSGSGTLYRFGSTYSTSGQYIASSTLLESSAGTLSLSSANAEVRFYTGNSERMRIDSSGNVGIGTTSPGYKLDVVSTSMRIASGTTGVGYVQYGNSSTATNNWHVGTEGDGTIRFYNGNFGSGTERARITSGGNLSVGTTSSLGRLGIQAATADNTNYGIYIQDSAAALMFYVRNDGVIQTGTKAASPYNNTTATAANMVVDSAGTLLRSTSSIKYKTQVENLDSSHADAILNFRPVWYRSLCNADNKNWSWYGLIAEEVAEVEPRLVHWGYSQDDYEFIETQEEVQKERTITSEDGVETVETYTETETKQSKQLKADAQLKPEGVQYDRLTVLLLDIVKRQDKRIEALEAEVAALKGQ